MLELKGEVLDSQQTTTELKQEGWEFRSQMIAKEATTYLLKLEESTNQWEELKHMNRFSQHNLEEGCNRSRLREETTIGLQCKSNQGLLEMALNKCKKGDSLRGKLRRGLTTIRRRQRRRGLLELAENKLKNLEL